ncbi:MAG: DUF167 domain-containing protein [Candidatus Peribacteraceae bacterium]|nr:DUF167 domain-containing protein [Candidatus Peribacteraceae bacterium]MDD5739585.1 DUF167 domain-containing protein [Candidatus Peribacteraceae bacterium]
MFTTFRSTLQREREVTFAIRVHAGAARTKVKGALADGTLKVDIAAVPEDGKANAALIRFLAQIFAVPKSHVEIVRGQTSKTKVVHITAAP